MRKAKNVTVLTEGVIWKQMLKFFFPILLGSFFQQLYSISDAVIVGQFAGKEALAAVDATGSLINLFTNIFIGMSTGTTIIISQYYGAGRHEDLSKAVHTGAAFALLSGAAVTVAGVLAAPVCLAAMHVPDGLIGYSADYARIIFAGMVPSMAYNIGSGILRAVGDSRRPFLFLVVSCLANIVLDLLFVAGFGWHVRGAAAATVLSQTVSAVLVSVTLRRSSHSYRLIFRRIRLIGPVFVKILKTGVPIALQTCVFPVSNLLIHTSINRFGTDTIAAWAVCAKLEFIIWTSMAAFGITASTFAAQNYGAGHFGRILKGTRIWACISAGIVLLISAALLLWGKTIGFWLVPDAGVIDMTGRILRVSAPFYVVYLGCELLPGVIRGTGETLRPMIISILGICVFRVIWVQGIVPLHRTIEMVAASYPLAWVLTTAMFMVYYRSYIRKRFPRTA